MPNKKVKQNYAEAAEKLYWELQRKFISIMRLHVTTLTESPLMGSIPMEATGNRIHVDIFASSGNFTMHLFFSTRYIDAIKNFQQKESRLKKTQAQLLIFLKDLMHPEQNDLATKIVNEIRQLFKDLEMIDCL